MTRSRPTVSHAAEGRRLRTRLSDVARQAGVSKVAVGKVLLGSGGPQVRVSEATAARIRRIARELNYQPNLAARQLAGKGSGAIGVVAQLAPGAHFEFLAHLEQDVGRRGYHLVISQASGGPDDYKVAVEELAARGVDGMLCVQHQYPGREDLIPFILSCHRHVVFTDRLPGRNVNYVSVDRAEVARMCVRHLANRGCRRIALALVDVAHSVQHDRRRGFLEELARCVPGEGKPRLWVGDRPCQPTQERLDEILDLLVEDRCADGIIANNDYWAMGLIKALRRRGKRIPDDVAVVGYGNDAVGTLIDPELTTVDPRNELVAARALEMLMTRIQADQPPPPEEVCLRAELIVRAST